MSTARKAKPAARAVPSPTGPGRATIDENGEVMKPRTFRMTDDQHEAIQQAGGGDWVRRQADKLKARAK